MKLAKFYASVWSKVALSSQIIFEIRDPPEPRIPFGRIGSSYDQKGFCTALSYIPVVTIPRSGGFAYHH